MQAGAERRPPLPVAPVGQNRPSMRHITDDERRARLARRHHLLPDTRIDDAAKLTDDLVALHSSDPATVYLSLLVRMASPDVETIDAALYEDRTLVRHHAMRRTMWVMTRATARRAHAAATERIAAEEEKRTAKALRDTADVADPETWLAGAKQEVVALIAGTGPLDARSVGRRMPHLSFPVVFGASTRNPATLNAHTKVLQGAAFDAMLVRGRPTGGWTSSEYEWAATEAWLGEPIAGADPRQAATELVDHYLRRFGPATDTDIRWWFGWTATVTRRALTDAEAEEVTLDERTGWVAAGDDPSPDEPEPWVRLLPGLDATTMGWKERAWYLDEASIPALFDRSGNPGPTVWADGRIVGGWVQRPDGEIALDLHVKLSKHHHRLLDHAIDELRAAVGDVIVKPRFPSPNQTALLNS